MHLRPVAQVGAGQRDVGQGMFDVAGTAGFVARGHLAAAQLAQQVEHAVELGGRATGDVEHPPHRPRRLGRQQVGLDDVVDVAKVARLLAVAEDHRLALGERGRDEPRDHGGVLRGGILPRSEDVEVAEHHRLDPHGAGIHLTVELAGQLRDRVGRQRRAADIVSTLGSTGVSPYADEEPA